MDAVWAVGNREEGKKFSQWSVWPKEPARRVVSSHASGKPAQY